MTVAGETWPELELTHNLSSADYYFDSRAHHSSHQDMLHDQVSMGAFRKVLSLNRHLIAGKTVLVVGSGLPLLPLFVAECGASAVFVHCQYRELSVISELVVARNASQTPIKVLSGPIESVQLPEKVDVVVSELVGCFLFYESKISDFLYARDHFLKPDGLLLPERLEIFAAGVFDGHERRVREEQWKNFWGVDLSPLEQASKREPFIDLIDERNIVTEPVSVLNIDLYSVSPALLSHELPVAGEFVLTGHGGDSEIGGVVLWFDVAFDVKMHAKHVEYSTSPYSKPTVWKQTTLTLDKTLSLEQNETCAFRIAIRQTKPKQRSLEVKLGYSGKNEFYRLA